jgi:hypothetical protein
MKKAFDALVKPASDELGKLLDRKVEIFDESQPQTIKVTTYRQFIKPDGDLIFLTPEQVRSYNALGLSIRSKE